MSGELSKLCALFSGTIDVVHGALADPFRPHQCPFVLRFGVGAKRAAFFLGPGLRVTTKTAGDDFVYEADLSLDTLHSSGWCAPSCPGVQGCRV